MNRVHHVIVTWTCGSSSSVSTTTTRRTTTTTSIAPILGPACNTFPASCSPGACECGYSTGPSVQVTICTLPDGTREQSVGPCTYTCDVCEDASSDAGVYGDGEELPDD